MWRLRIAPVIKGALTFIPGASRLLPEAVGTQAPADYCYGIWLKHLVLLYENGMHSMPRTVVELGPGSSLGTGFAALLSGADHYIGLDKVPHAKAAPNPEMFDELLDYFRSRKPRPSKGWPDYDDYLDENLFPSHILTEERLDAALAPERIARIREAIACLDAPDARPAPSADISIRYISPWIDEDAAATHGMSDCADLIISHAVLSHVDDLAGTYRAMSDWLKHGGMMSHQIPFEYPGFNGIWNGYWTCPDALWKIIRGRRDYSINRMPSSAHLHQLAGPDTRIVCALKRTNAKGIRRSRLSSAWRHLSDEDLRCTDLFVQARKATAQ